MTIERALIWTAAASLVFTLIVPTALIATEQLHHADRADEKTVAIGLIVLFASIALMFLARLATSLEQGETLGVENYWGGLGGGVGGWRISRPIAYLVCLATFGGLTAVAVSRYPVKVPPITKADAGGDKNEPSAEELAKRRAEADAKAAAAKKETESPATPGSNTGALGDKGEAPDKGAAADKGGAPDKGGTAAPPGAK